MAFITSRHFVSKYYHTLPLSCKSCQDLEKASSSIVLDVLCDQAATLGCTWIGMDAMLFSPEMPEILQRHNLRLGVWTVNSLEELSYFATAGVDALTTDRLDLFAQLRPFFSQELIIR